ncbi:MAG: hypothetical protein ABTD50_20530 [Polyangiaceae bacterium]
MKSKPRRVGATETFSVSVDADTKRTATARREFLLLHRAIDLAFRVRHQWKLAEDESEPGSTFSPATGCAGRRI